MLLKQKLSDDLLNVAHITMLPYTVYMYAVRRYRMCPVIVALLLFYGKVKVNVNLYSASS